MWKGPGVCVKPQYRWTVALIRDIDMRHAGRRNGLHFPRSGTPTTGVADGLLLALNQLHAQVQLGWLVLASSYFWLDSVARLAIEIIHIPDVLNDEPLYDRGKDDLGWTSASGELHERRRTDLELGCSCTEGVE